MRRDGRSQTCVFHIALFNEKSDARDFTADTSTELCVRVRNTRHKHNLSKSTYALLARFRLAGSLGRARTRAFAKSRGEIFMATVFASTSVIPRTIRRTSIQSGGGNLVSRGRNFSLPVSSGVPPFELTSKRYDGKRVAALPKEFSSRVVHVQKISASW